MTQAERNPWQPLSPAEMAKTLSGAAFKWWIAGGHAIDSFVGRQLRPHGDIDVLVLHADSARVRARLADWDCWAADPPGTLRPWAPGETLPASVSDVWCRERREAPWRFQLMLDQGNHRTWRSRRCSLVCKSVSELTGRASSGIPVVVPEVPLFYKAKAPRPKDEVDFAAALPLLSTAQLLWLREALAAAYGEENGWLATLRCSPSRRAEGPQAE